MMCNALNTIALGEIATISGGKRLPKGCVLTTKKTDHPYIRVRDLNNVRNIEINDKIEYISDDTFSKIKKYIVRTNDIVISTVGTIGLIGRIGNSLDKANLTENCVKINVSDKVDSKYLYYFLKSEFGQDEIRKYTVGAVQPKLPIKSIREVKVFVRSKREQEAVAKILSAVDDRIENNNKINDVLEEIAQALFKRWFVDFEFPNEDGNPYKSSGGKMVEREIGLIPEGWINTTFGDIVRFIKGKKPSKIEKKRFKNSGRYLTIDNMKNNIELYCETEKMTVVQPLDIMMIMDGASSGTIHYGDEGVISSTASKLEMDKNYNNFIYCFLKFHEQLIKDNTTGSAIPHTDKGFVNNFAMSLPMNGVEDPLFTSFDSMINSYREKVISNNIENNFLKELRDSLLPKLMSDEIKVCNVKGE